MIGHRLHNRSSIPGGVRDFFLFFGCDQTGSGAHPALCVVGIRGFFSGGK